MISPSTVGFAYCVLQCIEVRCIALQRVTVCGSVWQCVAVCDSVLQRVAEISNDRSFFCWMCLLCVAVRCSVLQCVAVWCRVLQCGAEC